MRFHLMHLEDTVLREDVEEEVRILTPGAGKVAIAVPLDAVPAMLGLLDEALEGLEEQCCEHCGDPLARRQRGPDAG